jgi:hypothetical protein
MTHVTSRLQSTHGAGMQIAKASKFQQFPLDHVTECSQSNCGVGMQIAKAFKFWQFPLDYVTGCYQSNCSAGMQLAGYQIWQCSSDTRGRLSQGKNHMA